jgi:hypothetical protein
VGIRAARKEASTAHWAIEQRCEKLKYVTAHQDGHPSPTPVPSRNGTRRLSSTPTNSFYHGRLAVVNVRGHRRGRLWRRVTQRSFPFDQTVTG